MAKVNGIHHKENIDAIKTKLKLKSQKEYLIFNFSINTGISISEILLLKRCDVQKDNQIKDNLEFKNIKYCLPCLIRSELKKYIEIEKINVTDYIFKNKSETKELNRSQFYRDINLIICELGLDINFGNKSCEKTFGHHFYLSTHNMNYLSKLYRNKSQAQILDFIEIKIGEIENYNI